MCAPDGKQGESNKNQHPNLKSDNIPCQVSNQYGPAGSRTAPIDRENTKREFTMNAVRPQRSYIRRSHSLSETSSLITAGTLASLFFAVLASYLPFFMAPRAAEATYHYASFDYHADFSHFDNSIWTYGTDYVLAISMGILIWSFPKTRFQRSTTFASSSQHPKVVTTTTTIMTNTAHVQSILCQGMLFCYLLSVLAGGLAHQFYTTTESRGLLSFRLLWTICVGTVTAAPAFMGSIGTELVHVDRETGQTGVRLPSIPMWFWGAYAVCSTVIVMTGGMSYQRPACDIFMAGVTQSPSTFYLMAVMGLGLEQHSISKRTRYMGAISFILNAPLLPLYPLLVQYTNWSLGAVNTLLHAWLLVAWGMQGISLREVAIVLNKYDEAMAVNSIATPSSSCVKADEKKDE